MSWTASVSMWSFVFFCWIDQCDVWFRCSLIFSWREHMWSSQLLFGVGRFLFVARLSPTYVLKWSPSPHLFGRWNSFFQIWFSPRFVTMKSSFMLLISLLWTSGLFSAKFRTKGKKKSHKNALNDFLLDFSLYSVESEQSLGKKKWIGRYFAVCSFSFLRVFSKFNQKKKRKKRKRRVTKEKEKKENRRRCLAKSETCRQHREQLSCWCSWLSALLESFVLFPGNAFPLCFQRTKKKFKKSISFSFFFQFVTAEGEEEGDNNTPTAAAMGPVRDLWTQSAAARRRLIVAVVRVGGTQSQSS